jgi:hypothetical protein
LLFIAIVVCNAEAQRRGEEYRTLNVERPTPNAERGSGDWAVLAFGVWGCGRFGIEPGRMMRLEAGFGGRRTEAGGQRTLSMV